MAAMEVVASQSAATVEVIIKASISGKGVQGVEPCIYH